MNLLEEAIKSHNLQLVEEILVNDPPVIDIPADDGCHMAFIAAREGDLEIVKYIVEYSRASMNIYDKKHRGILHYGVESGNLEVVRYLTERVGMNPLEGDLELITPYDLAYGLDNPQIYDYFVQYCGGRMENMYRNPIRTGMFPDPSVVRVGDDYYMVNSTFIFFPCIPVSHSRDFVNWEIIGYAITNPKWAALDELEGGRGYWAPDISYHDGRFFITATYRLNDTQAVYRKQIIVSSDKPQGPYSEPAIIDEDGIDPSIFVDDDGRKYMLLNRGARIFELNKECTKQISKAQLLYYGDYKRAPEGPHLLKKDGFYYLFEAEGGTGMGHRITVSRSQNLYGPYKPCPYNPIMRQNDDSAPLLRCGHGKPVKTQDGQWFMVYLCARTYNGKYSILGRETALDPITWTADGWPIVNNLDGPGTLNLKPKISTIDTVPMSDTLFDDFDAEQVKLYWMYPRPPHKDAFKLSGGRLCITGSTHNLDSTDCRSIILQRQRHFCFECDTHLTLDSLKDGQDAGLTCYYDENTWLKFGVFGCDGRTYLKVEEYILDTKAASAVYELSQVQDKVALYLKINTQYLKRTFSFSMDGKAYEQICELDNVYYLCDEGVKKGKRFTGAMVGMYAHSGEEGSLKAYFDYFKYSREDI
jgi:xylan 1,4-beta-xylosidase